MPENILFLREILPAGRPTSKKEKIALTVSIALGLTILAIVFFEWNLLRGPIGNYVSTRLERRFAINGDLHVRLANPLVIDAERITLANTPWASDPLMVEAQRAVLQVDLKGLFSKAIILPDILLVKPKLSLERIKSGDANWMFPGRQKEQGLGLEIGRLRIDNGTARYLDRQIALDATISVNSDVDAGASESSRTRFKGEGRFHNEPFFVEGSGSALLSLRETGKPYELDLRARAGKTKGVFTGQFIPLQLDGLGGRLELQGDDLSKLYPLVPLPLPWTPPYRIAGNLEHKSGVWSYQEFNGSVGNSDFSGEVSFNRTSKPPAIVADLVSHRLDYKDLGGFVGVPPGDRPQAKNSQEQKQEAATRAASTKVLSDKPYRFERLRDVNADIRFRGERIVAEDLPFDNLASHAIIKNGLLKLQPLDFGVGGGRVRSNLVMDVSKDTMTGSADIDVRNVELSAILPHLKPPKGNAGKVGGHAKLSSSGNSVAQLAGAMDGELALVAWGGKASTLTLFLTNLDLAHAAELLLRGDDTSEIRCLVADFPAKDGVMNAKTLVVDTTAVNIIGEGSVDFRRELYDLRLKANSKRASLVALRGPIVVQGPFKHPRVGPDIPPVAGRVAASAALGALATPLAALLPLIDLGGGKDSDCPALIQEAQARGKMKIVHQ